MAEIVFITGTSTGVGKTVATGLLLHALRQRGVRALAVKPFCTGSRSDVRHLRRLQANELTPEEINPFFYAKPLAPYVAAQGRSPLLPRVLQHIRAIAKRCDVLLVEGAGGLLVPLGPNYSAAEIVAELGCSVVVVAPNKLGTLNHTLLTLRALQTKSMIVLLMGQRRPDLSARTNAQVLRRMLKPVNVVTLRHLGPGPLTSAVLKKNRRTIHDVVTGVMAALEPRCGKNAVTGDRGESRLT